MLLALWLMSSALVGPALEVVREVRYWFTSPSGCPVFPLLVLAICIGCCCFCLGLLTGCVVASQRCRNWLWHCAVGVQELWVESRDPTTVVELRRRLRGYRAWARVSSGLLIWFYLPLLACIIGGLQPSQLHLNLLCRWTPNLRQLISLDQLQLILCQIHPLLIRHRLLWSRWIWLCLLAADGLLWNLSLLLCINCWLQGTSPPWTGCALLSFIITFTSPSFLLTGVGLLLQELLGLCELCICCQSGCRQFWEASGFFAAEWCQPPLHCAAVPAATWGFLHSGTFPSTSPIWGLPVVHFSVGVFLTLLRLQLKSRFSFEGLIGNGHLCGPRLWKRKTWDFWCIWCDVGIKALWCAWLPEMQQLLLWRLCPRTTLRWMSCIRASTWP